MSDDTRTDVRGPPEQGWPSFALPRGTVVNGYRIERILGSGGFGITYLALDLLQQRFAIKEYYPRQFAIREQMTVRPTTSADTAMFEDCRERFEREAKALVTLGRVAGDGIVHVQTYFEAFGTCFLVMDYVEGTSLANVFRAEPGGLSPERVRTLLMQLLASVRIVHDAGLVHRDIKPANIILRDGDRLVLIDFGATRQAAPTETLGYTQIYSGGYGPPEQMLGHRQGTFSDIYAIGAVCYRAIGGRPANALARQNSLAAGLADPQPTAASIGAGRYPPDLLAAIDAALSVEPAKRPQSADAMLAMLRTGEPAEPAAAIEPRQVEPVQPRPRRRVGWMAAAALAIVVVAGVGYLVLPGSKPPHPVIAASARFQRAQVAAAALPCAALRITAEGDRVRAFGFAPAGNDLDWFLAGLRDVGPLADDVTRVERSDCPVLAAMGPLVRATWDKTPAPVTIRLDPPAAAPGARVGIGLTATLPAVYIDLYEPDGSVRHLLRPGSNRGTTVAWTATAPFGGRLLVAFGAAEPLDLGARPYTERSADYLEVLRRRLGDGPKQLAANLAVIQVQP